MSRISADSISSRSGGKITINNDLGVVGVITATSINASGIITASSFYLGSTPLTGAASISTTAPISPANGQQWFDSSDGNTYIWYASQNVWVVSQTYGY